MVMISSAVIDDHRDMIIVMLGIPGQTRKNYCYGNIMSPTMRNVLLRKHMSPTMQNTLLRKHYISYVGETKFCCPGSKNVSK